MAVADAPARALVIYGDGLMTSLKPSHSHLHGLAASGACGFLALRHIPPQVDEAERVVFELGQLLDVHNTYNSEAIAEDCFSNCEGIREDGSRQCCIPSISQRFMGMKAAMVTNLKAAANLGKSLGFSVSSLEEIESNGNEFNGETLSCKTKSELPNPLIAASKLLEMLGFPDLGSKDTATFELVVLHVGGSSDIERNSAIPGELDWIDALVEQVKTLMQPGTDAASHLYLALVLGYGAAAVIKDNTGVEEQFPSLENTDGMTPELTALRPQQTYRVKDGYPLEDIRDHHPLLVVHQMDAVTRRDDARMLSFEEFQKKGGNLPILADRFLHEIAFKLWKAPKYGA